MNVNTKKKTKKFLLRLAFVFFIAQPNFADHKVMPITNLEAKMVL
jgi:hypothetical protein